MDQIIDGIDIGDRSVCRSNGHEVFPSCLLNECIETWFQHFFVYIGQWQHQYFSLIKSRISDKIESCVVYVFIQIPKKIYGFHCFKTINSAFISEILSSYFCHIFTVLL